MRWITHNGGAAAQAKPTTSVQVRTTLTGLESAELDRWVAAHDGEVVGVDIEASCVAVHGRHPYLSTTATATATRHPGRLLEALDDAFHRLDAEGGGC